MAKTRKMKYGGDVKDQKIKRGAGSKGSGKIGCMGGAYGNTSQYGGKDAYGNKKGK